MFCLFVRILRSSFIIWLWSWEETVVLLLHKYLYTSLSDSPSVRTGRKLDVSGPHVDTERTCIIPLKRPSAFHLFTVLLKISLVGRSLCYQSVDRGFISELWYITMLGHCWAKYKDRLCNCVLTLISKNKNVAFVKKEFHTLRHSYVRVYIFTITVYYSALKIHSSPVQDHNSTINVHKLTKFTDIM